MSGLSQEHHGHHAQAAQGRNQNGIASARHDHVDDKDGRGHQHGDNDRGNRSEVRPVHRSTPLIRRPRLRRPPRPRKNSDSSPKASLWNIQSRYVAARTMTMIEATAITGATPNDPTKTRNSPTKPERPGSPAEARMKKPKTVA